MTFGDLRFKLRALFSLWDVMRREDFLLGRSVETFEKELARYLGIPHALGVASGTDALVLALKTFDVGPGDEVIVPALGVFPTAGAIAWIGARPVFVDIDERSLNMRPDLIERSISRRTKAIIAVHLNGRMAEMDAIADVARRRSLPLIEDAAQAIGARYRERAVGFYGDVACLSFNPLKILNGYGDGGAVVTKEKALAEKVSLFRMYGTRFRDLNVRHPLVGVASRLGSFQAAVLRLAMRDLERRITLRRENCSLYSRHLCGVGDIVLPEPPAEHFVNGFRYAILTAERDGLLSFLLASGVRAQACYGTPLPYFDAFRSLGYARGSFPAAEAAAKKVLVLPTHERLSRKEIHRICGLTRRFYGETTRL